MMPLFGLVPNTVCKSVAGETGGNSTTIGSAMSALSFVMTRASSWSGPVQCVPQMPALARLRDAYALKRE